MNRATGTVIDVLFVVALADLLTSTVMAALGNVQGCTAIAANGCMCLLMAVLLCVYPKTRS